MKLLPSLTFIISISSPLACIAFTNTPEPITPIPVPIIDNPEEVELGRLLFNDVRLSKGNQLSCASCHSLTSFGGADGQQFSTGVDGKKGTINSPTIFNTSLSFRQFWNGRAANLVDQIEEPITNPVEMDSSWNEIVLKLSQDAFYLDFFKSIYDDGLTTENVKQAIIRFEESLLTPNSRFDQFLRGKQNVLSVDERKGYELFKQYGCISCHQGVAIGGNMYQKFGVLLDYLQNKEQLSAADFGRFSITKKENDRFVFKVPSLRNIALTAPYFHDGSVNSLSEAVKIMMRYQLGQPHNPKDVEKIVLFLKTLTGKYLNQPVK